MAFADIVVAVADATRFNTDYFARSMTFRSDAGEETPITGHVRHLGRLRRDDRTNDEAIVEQISVELKTDDVPTLDYGDAIILDDDPPAYLFAFKTRNGKYSYRATFERDVQTARGV